ncbi:MAG TPA: DUF3093 domain-containing protein [Pseudolysinimonas sp.]|nr:DUF3093 domain-containing protein [Pseudolysinimonas sp.]
MSNSSGPDSGRTAYRERLWPAPWVFIATALVIPASLLVFLPISMTAGVVCAVVLYGAIVATLLATTPAIEVDDALFAAGRARLPRSAIASVTAFTGDEATAQRGTRLDARAWLLLRGWIPDLVKVHLDDPSDPTPYWLVSTRHPAELAAALSR